MDLGGGVKWLAMGFRWGPMRVLGQEAYFAGWKEVTKLRDLDMNLEAGCVLLRKLVADCNGDEEKAVKLYFGAERKGLARASLGLLPEFQKFVEARPHEETAAIR